MWVCLQKLSRGFPVYVLITDFNRSFSIHSLVGSLTGDKLAGGKCALFLLVMIMLL